MARIKLKQQHLLAMDALTVAQREVLSQVSARNAARLTACGEDKLARVTLQHKQTQQLLALLKSQQDQRVLLHTQHRFEQVRLLHEFGLTEHTF